MKRKNEEGWEKDIRKSIGKGRIRAKRKKKQEIKKVSFFENISVPTGHGSSKFAVPGSKRACHGHACTV